MISSQAQVAMYASLPKTYCWHTRLLASMVIVTFLTSCVATDPIHQAGLKQTKEGPVDEGIAKLKTASANQPENQAYRVDYLRERERVVNQSLLDATHALGKGNLEEAGTIYQSVLSIDPENAQAKLGLAEVDRSKRHVEAIAVAQDALSKNDFEAAHAALQPVLIEDPQDKEAQDLSRQIDTARYTSASLNQIAEMGAAYKKPISLQFKDANLKMIFEAVSKTTGLNILLDKEIKADLKATVFVKQASVEDTINLILMQNQLEKKILNENTLYIYPSTPAKIKEHQDLVLRTFQLTNADVKQMQTLLKTMIKTKDIFINEKTNSIVIRDTPDAVALAAKLIAAQDVNEPEVMLEMEVLEVSHNLATKLGIDYPDNVSFTIDGSVKTLQDWRGINRPKINVTSSAPLGVTLNLMKSDGDVNTLANPRIRVRQHEKAKIHIGSRYPIITNTVTPSTGTPVVTGSIQYIDIGLKLEVEPDIHMDGEVGIKTSLEVSSLGANVTSDTQTAPIINSRNVNTVLRLKDGETQVLAGLINDQDINSATKVPGLGDIPLLGRLFSDNKHNKDKTELILAITPHIIRNIHQPDADIASYWSGTDNTVRSRPITVEKMEALKLESGGDSMPAGRATPPLFRNNRPTAEPAPVDSSNVNIDSSAPAKPIVVPTTNNPVVQPNAPYGQPTPAPAATNNVGPDE